MANFPRRMNLGAVAGQTVVPAASNEASAVAVPPAETNIGAMAETVLPAIPPPVVLTPEQLGEQLARLQARVADLEAKTKFKDMALVTITADAQSLTPTQQERWFKPEIRIDHPLANNNPNAVIFLQPSNPPVVACEYRKDGYWHLRWANFGVDGIEFYHIVEPKLDVHEIHTISEWSKMLSEGGLAHAKIYTPTPGEKLTLLILDPVLARSGVDLTQVQSTRASVAG